MSFFQNTPRRLARLAAASLLAVLTASFSLASVDDAKAAADTPTEQAIRQGFAKREEHWSGQAKTGAAKGVKAQLFKGNEYIFWLGVGQDDVTVTMDIYDAQGNKLTSQTTDITRGKSATITPPATGTYVVKFTVVNKKDPKASVDWAITYAYR